MFMPSFWPGEVHGLHSLRGHKESDMTERLFFMPFFGASQMVLAVKNLPANAGDIRDVGSVPGSGRSPGGGHGNPLQYYSCLENTMDRGAWWATVHGVTKSLRNWIRMHDSFLADVTLYDLHIRGWTISGHLNHVLSFPPLSTTKLWISYSSYIQTITISHLPMQMYFQHVIHMVKEVLTLKTSEFLTKKYLTSQISWSVGDTQQRHWCNALRRYDSLWEIW